ncbi:MAG: hypothetical protein OJF55_002424 [Rhodanobacteraceae bacterium]|nr:MAG: hypothetical protein OJF55_002424 [Rhodanobacteraceae bacterium]
MALLVIPGPPRFLAAEPGIGITTRATFQTDSGFGPAARSGMTMQSAEVRR